MLMRLILAGCALVIASAGTAFAEPRALSGFTSVDASAGTDVEVTVGSGFSVDVSGPGADRIVTRLSGNTLIVERQRGFHWGASPNALVRVTMPRVEGLSASSGSDLNVSGVNGGNVTLDSSSGADLRVSGRCASFVADVSSGADIHAQDLRCENGSVDASSGADARVFASGRLNVDASSGGGVVAYGNPGIGNVDLSSGGSLRRAD
jgi:hypothetical protein